MSSSPLYKQNKINKVDISLKQLSDLDTTNALYNDRLDNIRPNQILTSTTNKYRKDVFRFKYLTDLIQAGSGVTITDTDGVLTIASTGGGGGTYTVDNGLTPNPTANNFQLGGLLTQSTTDIYGSGLYSLNFVELYKHQVNSFDYTTLTSFDATLAYGYSAALILDAKGSLYKPGLELAVTDTISGDKVGIEVYDNGSIAAQQLWVKPHNYATATVGDVLTLQTDGSTEFQTPTGGSGGGLKHGTASGTNTYTVSISGVTSYADGDAYTIKFTNGNDADSTININSLGAKNLVKDSDIQITGGDILAGQELLLVYDGTNFHCIGVAPNQLFAYVTNDDTVTINKGQPVYAAGAAGNRMSVKLAYNTSDTTSAQTIGVVFSTSIAANQRGFIITQGVISGVNTAAYSAGNQLYLGSTAGTLTATKPHAPNHLVYIGIVERANAGNGQIYIKPQNGYELDELHNVQAQTPSLKDTLWYDTSDSQWKTASISTILGYTPVTNARSLTINGTALDLSADRSWTVGSVTSVSGAGTTAGLTLTGTVTGSGSLTLGGTLSTPVSTINDSTTVGQYLVKLANPSAISYLRINADNTVTALTLSQIKSDLGLSRTILGSDVSTTTVGTALNDVTGLSFSIVAGNTYKFVAYLIHTASPVNVGLKYAINANVAVTSVVYRTIQNGSVVSAIYPHHANALDSASTNSGSTVSNTLSTIEGILVASNTGTAIVRFGKSQANAGTLTVKAGSFIEYQTI